jgi:hypothetical protein
MFFLLVFFVVRIFLNGNAQNSILVVWLPIDLFRNYVDLVYVSAETPVGKAPQRCVCR